MTTIEVKTQGNRRVPVNANYVSESGRLAVHRTLLNEGAKWTPARGFTLTHVPTGRRIDRFYRCGQAIEAAKKLDVLDGWDFTNVSLASKCGQLTRLTLRVTPILQEVRRTNR